MSRQEATTHLTPIHFVHGNGVPSACYHQFLNGLDSQRKIYTLPVLGTDPNYPVTDNWPELVEQVADSIRRQANGPVIGVGHSLGAMCTYMAAHKYPELFRGLILMDPPTINGLGAFSLAILKKLGLADRVTPAAKSLGRREHWASREEAREFLGAKRFYKSWHPACFEDYLQYGLSDDPAGGVRLTVPAAIEVEIFRATPSNSWQYRKPLGIPGVLLLGKKSEFTKTGFPQRLAKQQGFNLIEVDGSHMFPVEDPQAVADLVDVLLIERNL